MASTISNGQLTATISHKGAELISLVANEREYMWEGNPQYWGKHAPVLFPIVGTLRGNRYYYENTEYSLPRHGFARDLEFDVETRSDDSVTFILRDSGHTLQTYPFRFELRISFTLRGRQLLTNYEVCNSDDKQMYFSLGAHPAFSLRGNFSDYSLTFEGEDPVYTLLSDGLLSDRTETLKTTNGNVDLTYEMFDRDALVFRGLKSRSVVINHQVKRILKVDFGSFPDLGIWTVRNAPFICIEPWFGYSDPVTVSGDLTEKPGILSLASGETFRAEIIFTLY